jgi:tripartite-type tricarboxylate transporter receptor subunit TctC
MRALLFAAAFALTFTAAAQAQTEAEMRARLAEASIDASPTTPDEFAAFIRGETERWSRVVKDANIPKQ